MSIENEETSVSTISSRGKENQPEAPTLETLRQELAEDKAASEGGGVQSRDLVEEDAGKKEDENNGRGNSADDSFGDKPSKGKSQGEEANAKAIQRFTLYISLEIEEMRACRAQGTNSEEACRLRRRREELGDKGDLYGEMIEAVERTEMLSPKKKRIVKERGRMAMTGMRAVIAS